MLGLVGAETRFHAGTRISTTPPMHLPCAELEHVAGVVLAAQLQTIRWKQGAREAERWLLLRRGCGTECGTSALAQKEARADRGDSADAFA